MTPNALIAKWRASASKERPAARERFIDPCRLPGGPAGGARS